MNEAEFQQMLNEIQDDHFAELDRIMSEHEAFWDNLCDGWHGKPGWKPFYATEES